MALDPRIIAQAGSGLQSGLQNLLAVQQNQRQNRLAELDQKLTEAKINSLSGEQPNGLFGKVQTQYYTPQSLQRFQQSKNYGDLKMIDALTVSPNTPYGDVTKPWERIPNADKRAALQAKFAEKAYDDLNKLGEKVDQAQKLANDFRRFAALNKENYTGLGASGLGLRGYFDPGYSEMKSLQDKLTPQMRQGMPGAASDRDVAMFKGAATSTDKLPEANQNIATAAELHAQRLAEEKSFKDKYFQSQGDLVGADSAWKKYLNDNPIFDPKAKKGSYAINPYRMPPEEYFSLMNELPQSDVRELIKLRREQGAK